MNEELQEGKVYFFADGKIKLANKKFTSIKNEFCIIFDQIAQPTLIEEGDDNIKDKVFNFTSISDISKILQPKSVDLIAIVHQKFDK